MSSDHTLVPLFPSRLSAILDEELRRCGASGHEVTQDTRLLDVDERLNEAELADWDAKLKIFYWEPEVAPESTLGPGPQLPVDAGITASRERPRLRRLAPAPTSASIPAPIPAPIVLPKRPGRPASKPIYERKVSCRVIGKKAEQACVRCRGRRQKCDSAKPECSSCALQGKKLQGQKCAYEDTPRQAEAARQRAAKDAHRALHFRSVEPPRPAEKTPTETHPLRPHFPSPGPTFGSQTALLGGNPQPQEADIALRGFPAPSLHPAHLEEQDVNFRGVTAAEFQYGGLPGAAFRGRGAMPRGFAQSFHEPGWPFRGLLETRRNESADSREREWAFGGPDPGRSRFSQAHQGPDWAPPPGFDWTDARNPSMTSDQIEQLYGGNQAALAHLAELDSMDALGYGRAQP